MKRYQKLLRLAMQTKDRARAARLYRLVRKARRLAFMVTDAEIGLD